jgi:hypothetical protein
MKLVFLSIASFFLSYPSIGQGTLNIYADSVIMRMMRPVEVSSGSSEPKKIRIDGNKEIPGYRVQVISSPDRTLVMKRKAAFLSSFPNFRVDYDYRDPYHRLRAGAFPSKAEAQKWINENNVKGRFPEAMPIYDEHVRMKELLDAMGLYEDAQGNIQEKNPSTTVKPK